jgi:hypothetical protein
LKLHLDLDGGQPQDPLVDAWSCDCQAISSSTCASV